MSRQQRRNAGSKAETTAREVAATLNRALQCHQAGQLGEAVTLYRQVLAVDAGHADAWHLLGVALHQAGEHATAFDLIVQAIKLRNDVPQFHNNLGEVCRALGKQEEAGQHYQSAVRLKPDYAEAHNNLGNVLRDLGRLDDAVACHRHAVALQPGFALAHNNLALALMALGEMPEAVAEFRRAIALGSIAEGREWYRTLLYALVCLPGISLEEIFAEHRRFETRYARVAGTAAPAPHANRPDPARMLRVGFLSSDLRQHPVASNLLPLVEAHDPRQVSLHFYAEVAKPDAITAKFQALAAGWRRTVGQDDAAVAAMIREDGIDVLVCLAARYDHNRPLICALRPAPVQISLYDVTTTGLRAMDALITDRFLLRRDSPEQFTERPVRLPSYYARAPLDPDPPVNDLPMARNGFPTFGSFNNPMRLSDVTLYLWAELLQRLPQARLCLKYGNLYSSAMLRGRVLRAMDARGIAADRVHMIAALDSPEQHLARYHAIDIALDSYPGSGSTTSFEALWMGVPVLTLPGAAMVTRWTASMLHTLDLDALLAAPSREAFLERGIALCAAPESLAALRASLRARVLASPLVNVPLKARHMERLYRTLWRRWCAAHPQRL